MVEDRRKESRALEILTTRYMLHEQNAIDILERVKSYGDLQTFCDSIEDPEAVAAKVVTHKPGCTPEEALATVQSYPLTFINSTRKIAPWQHQAAVSLASKEGLSYDAAMAKVASQGSYSKLSFHELEKLWPGTKPLPTEGVKHVTHGPTVTDFFASAPSEPVAYERDGTPIRYERDAETGEQRTRSGISRDEQDAAVKLASAEGIEFDVALKRVRSGRVPKSRPTPGSQLQYQRADPQLQAQAMAVANRDRISFAEAMRRVQAKQ